jgi:hypothetical protein
MLLISFEWFLLYHTNGKMGRIKKMSKLHEQMEKTTFFAEKVLVLSGVKGAAQKWRMLNNKWVMGGNVHAMGENRGG